MSQGLWLIYQLLATGWFNPSWCFFPACRSFLIDTFLPKLSWILRHLLRMLNVLPGQLCALRECVLRTGATLVPSLAAAAPWAPPGSPSQCCGLETLSQQSREATLLTRISTLRAPGPALPDGQGLTTLVSFFYFSFPDCFRQESKFNPGHSVLVGSRRILCY